MLCPKCQKWEIGKQDVHCSWCRWKLVDFTVSLNASHLCVNQLHSDLTLTIAHTGPVGNLHLDDIKSDKPWLKIDDRALADRILRQGTSIGLPVEIDTLNLPDDYHAARVTVSSFVGERFASLEIVPKPEFRPALGDYTVLLDPAHVEPLRGHLAITRGVATVEEIRTDASWAKIEMADQGTYPFRLDARSSNRLDLCITLEHGELLRQMGNDRALERTGQLWVKYAEFDNPRTYPFQITCLKPPKLIIPDETRMMFNLDVFTGKRKELKLTLRNGESNELGRADLQILAIDIESPHLQLSGAPPYPLTIESGQSQPLRFIAFSDDASIDSHVAKISFLTNQIGEAGKKEVFVEINVREMPDYKSFIAIDFGTVNSCCAFIDRNGMKFINIDEQVESYTTPSTILYYDRMEDGIREYEIGFKPYDFSFDPEYAKSTVKQIKRYLGKPDRFTVSYEKFPAKQDRLLPREITADILKRVLERAEEAVQGRIRECTISHPSRFLIRQIEDLKTALISCGIDADKITTMHEPLGAALSYIHDLPEAHPNHDYHMMVYDFGGGTTDITLLRITSQYDSDQETVVITPKLLGATGDRWLGGEDVTDLVIELILNKAKILLAERNPSAMVDVPFNTEKLLNPLHRKCAIRNQTRLRRFAEEVKIKTSEKTKLNIPEEKDPPFDSDEQIDVIINGDVKENYKFKREDIAPGEMALNDWLRPILRDMAEMMRHLATNNGVASPEKILLSGKSSALRIVKQVIEEAFPESNISMPSDLKECVVKGACHYSDPNPSVGVRIEVKQSECLSATTSYLGIRGKKHGQTVFHKLIDAGVPIPPVGLKVPVKSVPLKRNTQIELMENTSLRNELEINGKLNRNISELGTFHFDKRLREMEHAKGIKVTDEDLMKAKIELEITSNLNVRLIAHIPGIKEPIEFETELSG